MCILFVFQAIEIKIERQRVRHRGERERNLLNKMLGKAFLVLIRFSCLCEMDSFLGGTQFYYTAGKKCLGIIPVSHACQYNECCYCSSFHNHPHGKAV